MATHTRDEAWRSLQALFQALPADAVVDIRKIDDAGALPKGAAMTVKIEVIAPKLAGADLQTWAAPPVPDGGTSAAGGPAEAGEKPTPKPRRGAAKAAPKSTAQPPAGASQSGQQGQTGAAPGGQPDK